MPMLHSPSASCWFKIQVKGLCFIFCQNPGPILPRSSGSWPVSHCPKGVYVFYRTQVHPHSVSRGSSSLSGSTWHRLVECLCLGPWHAAQCLRTKGCKRNKKWRRKRKTTLAPSFKWPLSCCDYSSVHLRAGARLCVLGVVCRAKMYFVSGQFVCENNP